MQLHRTAHGFIWKENHGAIFYPGGAAEAGIFSVAPAGNLMIWVWLSIAAGAAICVLPRKWSVERLHAASAVGSRVT
jgi:hypothetical protein